MGSVAVVKDGNAIYKKSVGFKYITENEKKSIDSNSKFRIASVTKTFTAVMIFQLIDEGKIKLDDRLSEFFPEIQNADEITIANMLNHSSGIFDITHARDFNEHIPTTKNKLLDIVVSNKANFKPNEKHQYSNTNYVLLGYILEHLENSTYKNILKNRIVYKLQLKQTYFGTEINTTANECLSFFYNDDGSVYEAKQAHLSNPGGAGGIVSNPTDVAIFYDALFKGKLISNKSFKVMTTIEDDYGSGIFSAKKGGKTIFAHNGSIDAFKALAVYVPKHKFTIVLNANALDYSLMSIMFNILDVLTGKDIKMPSFSAINISEAQIKQYVGVYICNELPFNLVFESEGNALKGGPQGGNLKILRPTGKNEFKLEAMGITLNFNLESKTLLFKEPGEPEKKFIKQE
jgi:CubicO group peptidase (beta-lactamase class C family)